MEERLTEIEIRLTHFEHTIDELSDVIARQDQTMDLMAQQIRRLQERLREMASGWQPSPQDEKPPPHY